ncbi:MAG: thiamine-phosphate kinase [Bacteroidetes bacterium]|nr:thiamine-phosphate kinase [Bacteroidota bacterium]
MNELNDTNQGKHTPLTELGEFGLIEHLTKGLKNRHASTVKGVGDDAAVLDYQDKMVLVSTDLLVEGVHFDLTYMPLKHLGYKAAAVNISDMVAMNGVAKQITVSIAVSSRFTLEAIEELYAGIKLACERYQVDLVGGDTTSSVSGLFISITVIGEGEKERIVYRNGAKENDLLCVTGDLGAAYLGLLVLEREKQAFKANPNMQPELEGYDYVLERQLKPEPRTDIIDLFRKNNLLPTSMIDISDGPASEILHICRQSEVGCNLYEEKIPIDQTVFHLALDFHIDPTTCALSGGEDYEILFTISQKDFELVNNMPGISVIGHITDQNSGVNLITRSGASVPITAQGWDALLRKEKEK